MDAELIDRLGEFVCGYRLREDDAAVIRAAIAALSATTQAAQPEPEDVLGWVDESCIPSVRAGDAVVIRGVKPEDGRRYAAVTLATPQADEVSELRGVIERQQAMLWCLLSLHGGSVQVPDKLARERPTNARVHVAPGLGCTSLWIDQPATPQAATPQAATGYIVDAVAWESFVADYSRYVDGKRDTPFVSIREGLAAVIDSARPATPQAAQVPEGYALVPVTELVAALAAVDGVMQDAYNRCGQVCCGRGHVECCGNPILEWEPADDAIMSGLQPVHATLSAMLAAAQAQGDARLQCRGCGVLIPGSAPMRCEKCAAEAELDAQAQGVGRG